MRRTWVVVAVAAALVVVLWTPTAASAAPSVAARAPICTTAPADYPPSPQGCVPAGTPTTQAAAANADRSATAARSASAGALARTGNDHLLDLVRLGILAVGVGALVLYVRRRTTRQLVTVARR